MKRSGFTLIELLVVIAIIAILAAILFPVFARARAKAQQSNCLSNVKQIALGVLMYANDYDDMLPWSWAWGFGNQGSSGMALIYPYVKNLQIFACPAETTKPVLYTPTSVPQSSWGPGPFLDGDYTLNPCLGAIGSGWGCGDTSLGGFPAGAWPPLKQAKVNRPAEMIMVRGLMQTGWLYHTNPDMARWAYTSGDPWMWTSYNPQSYWPRIEDRHNNGGNFAFVDGHGKWLSREKAYAFDGSAGWLNTP